MVTTLTGHCFYCGEVTSVGIDYLEATENPSTVSYNAAILFSVLILSLYLFLCEFQL